jgi:hypothetical protein
VEQTLKLIAVYNEFQIRNWSVKYGYCLSGGNDLGAGFENFDTISIGYLSGMG